MNKRKLQHFKLAILLFGICVLFTNCQKENIEVTAESQLDARVKHITFAAFKSKTASSENYQKLNSFFDFNKTQVLSEYNRLESSDGAWIMTDEIVMIEREDKLFYTFKIGTVTSSDSFYNLLVITDVTGEIIDSKIFEYIPSSAWLEDTSQPFTGYMKLNDDDIFSISDLNGMLSRGGQLCITGTRDNWICSEGNNHDGPAPGRTCTWWENTITAIYGQCPPVLTPGDLDEGVPVGPGSSGGGGGGPGASTGTSNDDCVPAIDNPCDEDETVVLPPRDEEEVGDCLPDFICRPGEILDEGCECRIDLEDPCANKDLINYEVSAGIASLIASRQQPNSMVQSSQLVDSFILETIDDGWGDVNQDRFSIKINELPNGYTPFQLFNEIRMGFTNLVVGGDVPYITDVILEPYSDEDGVTWNSDNPVGAAMDFDTIFDTSTVYCVEYNEDEMYWIFATVTSYDHQGHFVAGLRQFGLEPNGSGGYSFYVRAADRLGGVLDYVANGLSGDDEVLFTQAGDKTWKNLMENTQSFIQNRGGYVDEFDETKTYGTRHPYDANGCQD